MRSPLVCVRSLLLGLMAPMFPLASSIRFTPHHQISARPRAESDGPAIGPGRQNVCRHRRDLFGGVVIHVLAIDSRCALGHVRLLWSQSVPLWIHHDRTELLKQKMPTDLLLVLLFVVVVVLLLLFFLLWFLFDFLLK
jgi:hypothetical protein